MIQIDCETLVTLGEACRIVSPRRPVHIATIWRWVTRGVGGQKLEAVKMGGRKYTSREALQRFLSRRPSE